MATHKTYLSENIGVRLVMIDNDRYGGAYSGAAFTAWPGVRPSDIDAGDGTCEEFWRAFDNKEFWQNICGRGDTPQAALKDLRKIWEAAGWEFDDVCRIVDVCGGDVFIFNSHEFERWLHLTGIEPIHQRHRR